MDGDQSNDTRNVIANLRKALELKKIEAAKYEEKYGALQRKLQQVVEPSRNRAVDSHTRKATRLAELKAAFDSKEASRNEEMDHTAKLLAALKLQRQNQRNVVQQAHREKLALIKRKTEIYQKMATLVQIANQIKSGKSAADAIVAVKADNQQKKAKLEEMKEVLERKKSAVYELRQKGETLKRRLAEHSGEDPLKKVAEFQAEILRLEKKELYLQNLVQDDEFDEADFVPSGKVTPDNGINDSGYNDTPWINPKNMMNIEEYRIKNLMANESCW